jgi:integrase
MAATAFSEAAPLTVSEWWPWWEIEIRARGCRPATVTYYAKALRKVATHFGDVPPAELDAAALASWRDSMRDASGLMASTVNSYLLAVLTFLRWLAAEGELDEAPTVRRLRVSAASLTPADVYGADALAQLAAGAQTPTRGRSQFDAVRDVAMLCLLQDSGIRASECAGLLLANIDLTARQAVVHADVAKAGYARTVCFGAQTARALAKYLRLRGRHEFSWCPQLFVGRRGPATYFLVAGVVRKAGQRGGVDGARAHRFRHTWADDMKRQGLGDETLMSLGGWRSTAMVARYGRAQRDARAVEAYKRVGSPVDRASMSRNA